MTNDDEEVESGISLSDIVDRDFESRTSDLPDNDRVGRRDFLKRAAVVIAASALPLGSLSAVFSSPSDAATVGASEKAAEVSTHAQFLQRVRYVAARDNVEQAVADFKTLMAQTGRSCVRDSGNWVVPSDAYADTYYMRDSYWVLAALKEQRLSRIAVDRFKDDQKNNADGHIATALRWNVAHDPILHRDDESTLLYVLHCYLLKELGGLPPIESLERAKAYILSHVEKGRYVTTGEKRAGPEFGGSSQVGTFHYWADTYRPAGKPEAVPLVIAYNQGLLCVALRCLEMMGVDVDRRLRTQAEYVYANMVSSEGGGHLPQREGSSTVDVSVLVGEALSLYIFDKPLLSRERVKATFERLAPVRFDDGSFLGFKVISSPDGGYRPDEEFSGTPLNTPGNYQNGASWLLYDALALYASARHHVPKAQDLFVHRLLAETRLSRSSHEYIRTNRENLGQSHPSRDGYGWNSFIINLLP